MAFGSGGGSNIFNITPGEQPYEQQLRQRTALALLTQGTSGEPVRAWSQGAARVMQALLGGYELHQQDEETKRKQQSFRDMTTNLPGMEPDEQPGTPPPGVASTLAGIPAAGPSAPAPSPAPPAPLGAMPMQPAPGSAASRVANGYADLRGGIDQGIIDPQGAANNLGTPPAPMRTAQAAPMPGGAAPTAMPQARGPKLTPQQQAEVKALFSNPDTMMAGWTKYQEYSKPKDQFDAGTPDERQRFNIPEGVPLAINRATGEPKFGQPNMSVNLQANTAGETEYSKGKATDALTLERSADPALAERQRLEVFKNLVSDFKTGKLAPLQTKVGAWADALGIDPKKLGVDPNAAVNGQLIESLSNQMTLGMIGTKNGEGGGMPANNFSDADRKFLQNTVPGLARVQGGNLILSEIKSRGLDRQLDKVAMWDDYRSQGKKYEQFERDWRAKIRAEPSLFADIPDKIRGLSAGPGGGGETGGPVTKTIGGKTYIQQNGQWFEQ